MRERRKLRIPFHLLEVFLIKESKTPVTYKYFQENHCILSIFMFLSTFFFLFVFPKKQLNVNYIQRRDCSDNIDKKSEVSYCFLAKDFQPTL